MKFCYPLPSFLPWLFLGPISFMVSHLFRLPIHPSSLIDSNRKNSKRWKLRTTFVARLCAAITGSWAVLILYSSPVLSANLMLTTSLSAQHLVAFSLGVHMAEVVDMIINIRLSSMLLVHHLIVIICFAGVLLTEKAVGFAVLSLVTEVNIVFNKTKILNMITSKKHHSVESSRTTEHLHFLHHGGG